MSIQKRLFIGVAAILFLANLLVMNDFTSLWDGPESFIFWQLSQGGSKGSLYEGVLSLVYNLGIFWFRLPGALLLLLAMPLYWLISQKIFGRQATLYTLLALAASLLMPNLAKCASGDVWAMVTQWLAFATLIRFLKQPERGWQLLFYLLLALAVWVQPMNALIFLLGVSIYLYFAHPQGKNLIRLQPWLAGPAFAGILYALNMLSFDGQGFVVGFRSGRFFLWNFLGLLPFLGFWMAGLWESFQRARKGEELARISLGAFIFAMLGHSLALQGILALLVAKQWQGAFQSGYPYKPIVLTGALLHLLGIFFAAILLMIGGFHEFGPLGFRAGVATTGAYWMLSFVGVIGLVGGNRRYVIGGAVLAGLLLTTLFWLQLNPLLESRRNWASRLVQETAVYSKQAGQPPTKNILVFHPNGTPFPKLAAYAGAAFPHIRLLQTDTELRAALAEAQVSYVLLPVETARKLEPDSGREIKRIEGWTDGLQPLEYVLLSY